MTLIEAISQVNAAKPNGYTQSEKTRWLSILDGAVKAEIIDTHEGAKGIVFNGYDDNTDIQTKLLIPYPFDDIYIRWLEMQIDYTNGEYSKYNNSKTMFNEAYSAYENYYNRNHVPIGKKFKFF